ncbi:PREDICTED: clathrin interactor EPSIN 1 isoform X2 [Tarenaya hassleriana]|nr:PREDICTED: clathrin interactor EPSIN 1 isoform X2 [Tarenaya hassleriana]
MVMNVLWTRLGEAGKDWRYVYKALAVIEYLISHGSDRAVDEIIEHTYQISSLTSFEYVEPNGKDVGINVRKKAENIVALLNNKEKIQETREKAASNRNKYVGLSSTGITYKSGSASYGGSYQSGSRNFDSYKDRDCGEVEKNDIDSFRKSRHGFKSDKHSYSPKKSDSHYGRLAANRWPDDLAFLSLCGFNSQSAVRIKISYPVEQSLRQSIKNLVKSGLWADSLSRGLIDLNITAPKKVSLADVGVVGDLSNVSGEQQKAATAAHYTGWSMGTGSGLGGTGLYAPHQQATDNSDDSFSSLSGQQ